MTTIANRDLDYLERSALVLLALQVAIFAALVPVTGFDRASEGYPILVMSTALFVAGQRRFVARPPGRGAAPWLAASRAAALVLLASATLAIGFYRLVPGAAPAPDVVPRVLFALLWVVIAFKGAGVGKLKPGSAAGLCVTWTLESRLAWDRGHRALGRVLFWGGLIGLACSPIVVPLTSLALWAATVVTAVGIALVESWRTWRLDPDRAGRRSV